MSKKTHFYPNRKAALRSACLMVAVLELVFCFIFFGAVFSSCDNETIPDAAVYQETENENGDRVRIKAGHNYYSPIYNNYYDWSHGIDFKDTGYGTVDDNVGFVNLDAAFDWIRDNIDHYNVFFVLIDEDQIIKEQVLNFGTREIRIMLRSSDGNEKQISNVGGGSLFFLSPNYSSLVFCIDQGITLKGRNDTVHAVVEIGNGNVFVMNPGSSIKDNHSINWDGSSIHVRGRFHMYGGTITSGDPHSVYVDGGRFVMNDGTISDSEVYVRNNGTFVMNGGILSASSVSQHDSNFVMNNGIITNSKSDGVSGSGTFIMNNGTISRHGGRGVRMSDGNFIMNRGTIHGNVGGVYLRYSTFTMYDGVISGSICNPNGGGVQVWRSTFIKHAGTIYGNDGTENANISLRADGITYGSGHAVSCGFILNEEHKRRNITAGPDVYLEYNYDGPGSNASLSEFNNYDGVPTFSGGWDN